MKLLKRLIIVLKSLKQRVKFLGKIPDVTNLATKTALTTVENKITNINGLVTKTALTAVENKIPDISNLATKTKVILCLILIL